MAIINETFGGEQRLSLNLSLLCILGGPGERLRDLEPLQMDGVTTLVSLFILQAPSLLWGCVYPSMCLAVMTLITVGEAVEDILADLS